MDYIWLIPDAAVVLIFFICVRHAYKKGFMRASYTILSLIITLVCMFAFSGKFEAYLAESEIGTRIEQSVDKTMGIAPASEADAADGEDNGDTAEAEQTSPLMPKFLDDFTQDAAEGLENAKAEAAGLASAGISSVIIKAVSVALLYLIIRLLLFVALRLLDFIFKLPLLKTANRLLGAAVGAVNALLVIYAACAVLIWVFSAYHPVGLEAAVSGSRLLKMFYDNNLLIELFI